MDVFYNTAKHTCYTNYPLLNMKNAQISPVWFLMTSLLKGIMKHKKKIKMKILKNLIFLSASLLLVYKQFAGLLA